MTGSTVTVPPLVLVVGALITTVSLSPSVTLTAPVTLPPDPPGLPTEVVTAGAILAGLTATVTGTVMVPPCPSPAVMVKVSI